MIPSGKAADKENMKNKENTRKGHGKVPKYLQRFNKEREDKEQ